MSRHCHNERDPYAAPTFLSLFAGIGGFDLGFERAGMRCVGQVEIDPYCRRVLAKHWPNVPRHDDVRTFARLVSDCEPEGEEGDVKCEIHGTDFGDCTCLGVQQIDDDWERPDIICGGDPCQENSNARRSADTVSPSLGGEFIRIVERLRPRIVVRENPATVRKDAPWPWWRFRGELERIGYSVLPFRLRACCVGADFRRDRLFLLGELPGTEREGLEGHVGQVVERANQGRHDADSAGSDRWSAAPRVCGRTPRVPHRVDRLRSLGNSVCPAVAEWIGRRIIQAYRETLTQETP